MHTKDNSSTHEWYVHGTLMLTLVNTKDNSSTHEWCLGHTDVSLMHSNDNSSTP